MITGQTLAVAVAVIDVQETRYIIAVDIGGTFTDAVIADYKNKALVTKTNSTPANPAIGFNAVENAIELASAKENEITTLFQAQP